MIANRPKRKQQTAYVIAEKKRTLKTVPSWIAKEDYEARFTQ